MVLIIGSYAEPADPGIYVYSYDRAGCEFKLIAEVKGIENPSYLTVNRNKYIYAVSENKTGPRGEIHAYKFDQDKLMHLSHLSYPGAGSCFVSVDQHSRNAFIANYDEGTLVVVSLHGDTTIGVDQVLSFTGSGPVAERQEQSHIHTAVLSPDQQFLYCTDLGADRLYRYHYAPGDKPLTESVPLYSQLTPGSGPRHIAFSNDGRRIYVICELTGDIFSYVTDEFPLWSSRFSVVDNEFEGKTEAGDIQIHPNGRHLYVSNRGDANEIVVLDINPDTGDLSFRQRIPSEGLSPRALVICAPEGLLIAANEQSNNVTVFNIESDGMLTYSGLQIQISKPASLQRLGPG